MSKKKKSQNQKVEDIKDQDAQEQPGAAADNAPEEDESDPETDGPEEGEASDETLEGNETGEPLPPAEENLDDEKTDHADETDEDALIEEQIAMVTEFFKAHEVTIAQEGDEALTVLSLLDEKGEEIISGPLHDLVEKMNESDPEPPADPENETEPKAEVEPGSIVYPQIKKKLDKMKIRWIGFDRRKVLRVMKDFEQDGKQFKAGEVFDWAVLGLKPYFVNRLYNRRVVRHVVEDSRVTYPFRAPRNPEKEQKISGVQPKESAVESAGQKDAQAGADEAPDANKEGNPANAGTGAKFTKKNAGRTS
jgi:hypothetical protein